MEDESITFLSENKNDVKTESIAYAFKEQGGKMPTIPIQGGRDNSGKLKEKRNYEISNVIVDRNGNFYVDTMGVEGKQRLKLDNVSDRTRIASLLGRPNATTLINETKSYLGVNETKSQAGGGMVKANNSLIPPSAKNK